MADNVAITAGTGTSIAADDVSSVFYQYVKLDVGADGAASHVVGSLPVTGDIAHDAADSGAPQKIGGKARTTNPTAVADADRVDASFDDLGRQIVVLHQARDLVGQTTATITNSTAETTILAAVAATFLDLTSMVITNATGTAVTVTIRDDTGGTIRGVYDLAANGGMSIAYPVPYTQTAVNKNWTATLSATGITVHFNLTYVKNV